MLPSQLPENKAYLPRHCTWGLKNKTEENSKNELPRRGFLKSSVHIDFLSRASPFLDSLCTDSWGSSLSQETDRWAGTHLSRLLTYSYCKEKRLQHDLIRGLSILGSHCWLVPSPLSPRCHINRIFLSWGQTHLLSWSPLSQWQTAQCVWMQKARHHTCWANSVRWTEPESPDQNWRQRGWLNKPLRMNYILKSPPHAPF